MDLLPVNTLLNTESSMDDTIENMLLNANMKLKVAIKYEMIVMQPYF